MDSTSTSSLGDPANSPVLPGCAWTRGPPYSAISAGFAEMIGLRHNREDVVEFADGQRESVVIVEVRLRIGEREAPTLAILTQGMDFLGRHALEALGLGVDPEGRGLVLDPSIALQSLPVTRGAQPWGGHH